MEQENTILTSQAQERPAFLTVLCVLTFIGSGLNLLGSIIHLLGSSAFSFLPGMKQANMIAAIISLFAAIFCLWGAIRMWSLYKAGFLLYVIGSLLFVMAAIVSAANIGPVIHEVMNQTNFETQRPNAKALTEGIAKATVWFGVVWSIIINALFIILYSLNKKHLVK